MLNWKKAAENITSKFGLLNAPQPLVLTISEERQVHETLLKLILARVNSATSLLQWAKNEENKELKDAICQLYDIHLMYAHVQRDYAELSNKFSVTLKEILQIQTGLDALRKCLKDVSEKRQKQQKLSTKNSTNTDELNKLLDQEEELKLEIDAKSIKGEIFKSASLKKALLSVCDASLLLSKKTELVFTAARKVIEKIPEVPSNLKEHKNQSQHDAIESGIVLDLAKELKIENPSQSNNSIFYVELPHGPSKTPVVGRKVSHLKKMIGKVGLERPLPVPPHKHITKEDIHWDFEFNDFVIISNKPAPQEKPPPIPRHNNTQKSKKSRQKPVGCECDYDSDDYAQPNDDNLAGVYGKLYRSSSDPNLTQPPNSSDHYKKPWDHYISWKFCRDRSNTDVASLQHYEKPFVDLAHTSHYERPFAEYSEPYECNAFSQLDNPVNRAIDTEICNDPVELQVERDYKENETNQENRFFCDDTQEKRLCLALSVNNMPMPNNTPAHSELNKEIVPQRDNTTKIMYKNLQKVKMDEAQGRILSKLDPSGQHTVLETKFIPQTACVRVSPVEYGHKNEHCKLHVSVSADTGKSEKLAKFPPIPKPRPKSTFHDACQQTEERKDVAQQANVRDFALQLKEKIRPVNVIPNITQASLKQSEYSQYSNDLNFK